MTENTPKKLGEEFSAAAETDQVLNLTRKIRQHLADWVDRMKKQDGTFTGLITIPLENDLNMLDALIQTIENDRRQDKKLAALEKRLAELEGNNSIIKLDKNPPPQP